MPKQNKGHKKKNQHNKNKKHKNQHRKRNNNKSKSKSRNHQKNNGNDNNIDLRIKEVKDVKELKPRSDASLSPVSSSIHSPIKLNYYDADHDISDSDEINTKIQILRSAKISHRDIDNNNNLDGIAIESPLPKLIRSNSNPISNMSPGFNKNDSPLLLSHRLPSLIRAKSSPIKSILRSPYKSPSKTPSKSPIKLSFGEVNIHEFKLLSGSESDGVPDEGGYSLHLDSKEINNHNMNVDEYEKQRYDRWKKRAKKLHWTKDKLSKAMDDPEKYLWTNGRCDEFYSYLTPKERERRLEINKEWKKLHSEELNKEKKELNEIRKSRKSNHIFCDCKPLSLMSTSELKIIAKQYEIPLHSNRKIKKGFLINRIKSKIPNNCINDCCWDKLSCSCIAAEIDCHSGSDRRNFQCGCIKYNKKCHNKFGQYQYKEPIYSKQIINEWNKYYDNIENIDNINHDINC